ncbi:MAG TPA: sucrase/ferredoxin-like family protein [Anaerolineae bacterium]|jgi:(2Fe-2S) ferredoxin
MPQPPNIETIPLETDSLPGTVKLYQRHLFVCTGRPDWPDRIEADGGFLQTLSETVQARADALPLKVKITACDDPGGGPGHDILVFPDAVRYRGVQEADLPALVEDHLVGARLAAGLRYEALTGQHVFICIHGRRDQRCGDCGPPLIERFKALLADHHLADQVAVYGTSHVGGHRFAGNVVIYPDGCWYGRVTLDDVPRIIEQHLAGGNMVTTLWRGQMGLSPEQQLQQAETWAGSPES